MVDEGWTTVEKKTPKEAASGGRGGGAGAQGARARSGARGDPRRSRPRDCPSLFLPHRRHGPQTLLCPRGAIGRPRARAPAPFAARPPLRASDPSRFPLRPPPRPAPVPTSAAGARMPRADPPITTAVRRRAAPSTEQRRAQVRRRRRPRRRRLDAPAATARVMPRATTPPTPASPAAPPGGAASPAARAVATAAAASVAREARTSLRAHQGPRLALAGHPVGQGWPWRDPGDSRRLRFPPRRPAFTTLIKSRPRRPVGEGGGALRRHEGAEAPPTPSRAPPPSACGKSKQWEKALEIFEEMKADGRGEHLTYSALISACAKGRQLTAPRFSRSRAAGAEPDGITFGAVSAREGARWTRRWRSRADARRARRGEHDHVQRTPERVREGRRAEEAADVYADMQREGVKPDNHVRRAHRRVRARRQTRESARDFQIHARRGAGRGARGAACAEGGFRADAPRLGTTRRDRPTLAARTAPNRPRRWSRRRSRRARRLARGDRRWTSGASLTRGNAKAAAAKAAEAAAEDAAKAAAAAKDAPLPSSPWRRA